jgi:flagellar hook-basal body complex protein FliE
MSIDPISAVGASAVLGQTPIHPDAGPSVDFANWMTQQLNEVNGQIATAERSLVALAAGDGNLHQVMLDLEKARTAFQLTLQVRNKLIEGYQELMRMQI